MAYLRLDTGFFRSPDVLNLSKNAKILYLASMCYVADRGENGAFPTTDTSLIAVQAGITSTRSSTLAIQELLQAGFWVQKGTRIFVPGVRVCPEDSNRPSKSVWQIIRDRIFERDDYACRYCGERGGRLECDHVVPVSRGGSHEDDNLVTACFRCNRSKRAKLVEEWQA